MCFTLSSHSSSELVVFSRFGLFSPPLSSQALNESVWYNPDILQSPQQGNITSNVWREVCDVRHFWYRDPRLWPMSSWNTQALSWEAWKQDQGISKIKLLQVMGFLSNNFMQFIFIFQGFIIFPGGLVIWVYVGQHEDTRSGYNTEKDCWQQRDRRRRMSKSK